MLELDRLPHAASIVLSPLDTVAVRSQVQQIIGSATPDEMATVLELGEGVPLFVEELVAAQFEPFVAGRIDVSRRLRELDGEDVVVVQTAALAKGPMTVRTLSQVLDRPPEAVTRVFELTPRDQGLPRTCRAGAWIFRA